MPDDTLLPSSAAPEPPAQPAAESELDTELVFDEEPAAGGGVLRAFLGLFVVPLVVVLLCVAVFIGFGWIAYERQTTGDYFNDLQSWWKPRRVQAAYELSKILVADPKALEDSPGAEAGVRRLFEETDDPEMRQYLALVLGHTQDPEAAPLLIAALDDPEPKTRIYSIWALGTLGHPSAREPLVAALASDDPGVRKTAAFALGELGDRAAVPALESKVEDPVADVRWNAALALARLGSDAGVPVLEAMLDRDLVAQVPGITREQQEDAMVAAVGALAVTAGRQALPLFERLEEGDPSLKVRQAAIAARKALQEG